MSATRRKSSMATVERISPNKGTPRTKTIRRNTPHCVAGNLSVESILGLAAFKAGGTASTVYAIGSDGRMGLGVEETNRPWTSSSATNDNEAITFEIANTSGSPDWPMSDAAINTYLDASVEAAKFYGFSKISYKEKPASITGTANVEAWIKTWAKDDEMIITLHNWYKNKECPGKYFMRQLPWLVKEMNKRLQNSKYIPEAFVGEGATPPVTTEPAPTTPPVVTFSPYLVRITAAALNVRKEPGTNHAVVKILVNTKDTFTIVEESTGSDGKSKWGKLKSGIGWISLDYTKKV